MPSIKSLIPSNRSHRDIIFSIIFTLILFLIFHSFEVFELIYELTREQEEWQADELVMLVLSLPLPLAWFAWRRSQEFSSEALKRLELERALSHSSKLESLGTLAGGVAHEINNQLTPVLSMTEMLLDQLPEDSTQRRKVELIHKGATRARETVLQIKRFATLRKGKAGECNVAEILTESRELVSHFTPSSIKVDFNLVELHGIAMLDCADLEAIIINLFSNAIDSIGKGTAGRISVDATTRSLDSKTVGPLPAGLYVIITISDSGKGIPEELQQRIFDPFYTTKKTGDGMGLGLSIVYSTIKKAKGEIRVTSIPESGSSFTLYLPVSPGDQA